MPAPDDIDAILPAIRGMVGIPVKTNVDLERGRLIQSTVADSPDATRPLDHSTPSGRDES